MFCGVRSDKTVIYICDNCETGNKQYCAKHWLRKNNMHFSSINDARYNPKMGGFGN